jgi:hypothetical protein
MKHDRLGPKNQGSLAFAALICVLCLGLGMYYALNSSRQAQSAVDQALSTRATELGELSNLSNLALLRGLMADRKVPGQSEFQPVIFPDNYFATVWDLKKNKLFTLPNVESTANRVRVRSFAPEGATIDSAKAIFEQSKTQVSLMTDTQNLEVVALNRSPDFPYYIASIDIKAGRRVNLNNAQQKEKNVTTFGRINLSAPVPQDMRLLVREEHDSGFSENFGTTLNPLKPGRYIFRLEGRGVIHHGEVIVGGDKKIVGLDSKGDISHSANNIQAYSVIGDTPVFDLLASAEQSKEHVSRKGCELELDNDVTPGSGSGGVNVIAKVIGVDGVEAQKLTLTRTLVVGKAEPIPPTGTICPNACKPLVGDVGNAEAPEFATSLDRALTTNGTMDYLETVKTGEINAKHGRGVICSNYELTAQEIQNRSGLRPSELLRKDPALYEKLRVEAMSFKMYVAYMAPACKREVVGTRQGCGCFEEKTQIQMADGSLKLASEIRAGDLVFNPKTARAQSIRRVIAGPERWPLLKVQAGGKSVTVTGEHPFLTKDGLKPAYKLSPDDTLIEGQVETKVQAVIQEERKADAEAPEVWNFELVGSSEDDDHYVLANGVMTGDLYLQQKLGKQGAASRKTVSE